MPEDNPARKSFEAGARAAREAAGRGTFNAKLLDIAPGRYDGRA